MDATRESLGLRRARPPRIRRLVAGAVIGALLGGSVASVAVARDGGSGSGTLQLAPDTFIVEWDATGSRAFTLAGLSPAEGHTIFAYVAIAVYDSVMAVHDTYEPFAVDADAPDGTSAEAAVAAAAHRVLAHYLPGQVAGVLDPAYATSLARIPDGRPKDDGVAVGEEVAAALIAMRADDGFRAPVTYTPPDPPIPGAWLPTATTPPIGPYLGRMRPFALRSADQFRPGGPPALDSKAWARDYDEVREIGSRTSTTRTADQEVAARFWAEAPVQQARGSFRVFVVDHELDVVEAARVVAMLSVTYADALIACFEAKYHYAFWRPITAIRAGATDGNDATVGDPNWLPLLPGTPNHPEYPSAHSCITPAGGQVIARYLGTDQIDFTVPSLSGLGDRNFATVKALRDEVMAARIWGGIHYRSAVVDGAAIARKVTNYILARHFKSTDD